MEVQLSLTTLWLLGVPLIIFYPLDSHGGSGDLAKLGIKKNPPNMKTKLKALKDRIKLASSKYGKERVSAAQIKQTLRSHNTSLKRKEKNNI